MLAGKTALITGAAGDLGNAMARHLAKNGTHAGLWMPGWPDVSCGKSRGMPRGLPR